MGEKSSADRLDYATPKPAPSVLDGLADALGFLFCIAAVCILLVGLAVLGAVIYRDGFLHRGGVNTGTDFFEAAMIIIIGAFVGGVGLRWVRVGKK